MRHSHSNTCHQSWIILLRNARAIEAHSSKMNGKYFFEKDRLLNLYVTDLMLAVNVLDESDLMQEVASQEARACGNVLFRSALPDCM